MNRPISKSFSTRLPLAEAHNQVEAAFEYYREQHPDAEPTLRWRDAHTQVADVTFKIGEKVYQGIVRLVPGDVTLSVDVPEELHAFAGMFMGPVVQEIESWIRMAESI